MPLEINLFTTSFLVRPNLSGQPHSSIILAANLLKKVKECLLSQITIPFGIISIASVTLLSSSSLFFISLIFFKVCIQSPFFNLKAVEIKLLSSPSNCIFNSLLIPTSPASLSLDKNCF